ncbi:MAG: BatA domain-containing protein [Phycisphaerae bacterium]|nr:BatA domain-containing protein [Phycisphaerae bacterium]
MPFIHPILFWLGAAGISIPVVIHILNRRRFRVVEWAAMRFLLEALRKNRRRLQLEELLLLALRCLVMLLLGVALARFVGCGGEGALPGLNGPRTFVFVLDDSASMGQRRGDETLFAAAKADLKHRLAKLRNQDRAAILLTSKPTEEKAFFRLGEITDRDALLGRLDALEPSDLRTTPAEAVQTARDVLAGAEGEKRLYLLSDCRQEDVNDAEQRNALQKTLADLKASGAHVAILDYGLAARTNLTLEKIEQVGKGAVAHQPARIALRIRNNGLTRAENAAVKLSAVLQNDDASHTVTLPPQIISSLGPGETWRREIAFTPGEKGFVAVTAELPADALAADNRATLAFDVQPATKVLLVDGKPNLLAPEEAESYFLRTALDPTGRGEHGFAVDVIGRNDLPVTQFDEYDVVFLLNVSDAPIQPVQKKQVGDEASFERYASIAALEQYVRDGGGLVICTGDRVDTNFYNDRLYHKGAGLLPLPIRSPAGDAARSDRYVRLDPSSMLPGGVMSFFAGEGGALTKLIRFFAFTPGDEQGLAPADASASAAVVEARYDDRDHTPAVVSRRLGRGRVVLITSTASMAWNDWAMDAVADVQGLYVLFVADLTDRLARPRENLYTHTAGRPIRLPLDEDLRDATAKLTPPGVGAEIVSFPPRRDATGRLELFSNDAEEAGLYRLRLLRPDGLERHLLLARNVDGREGRLAPAGKETLAAAWGRDAFAYVSRAETGGAELADAGMEKPYWIYFIVALIAAMAMETYLARRFGHW